MIEIFIGEIIPNPYKPRETWRIDIIEPGRGAAECWNNNKGHKMKKIKMLKEWKVKNLIAGREIHKETANG